jgi:hypothetical protein
MQRGRGASAPPEPRRSAVPALAVVPVVEHLIMLGSGK